MDPASTSELAILCWVAALLSSVPITAAWSFYRQRRRQQILDEQDLSAGCCIACEAEALDEIHEEAWRCRACGYEQGPGWERRRQAVHLERLVALSPEKAQAHAHAALRDARLALLGAAVPLRMPVIVEGSGNNKREFLNPDLLDAAGDIEQSWKRLQEALLIDTEVADALEQVGFDSSAPDCDGLYALSTAPATASYLRGPVRAAAEQVGEAMQLLHIEA